MARATKWIAVSLPILITTVLAACGSSSSGGTSGNTNTGASASANSTASGEPSASLIAKAKQEGKVVLYASFVPATFQALNKAFEAKYGIQLIYKKMASGASEALVGQQLKAGNVQVDVIDISPDPAFQTQYASDFADIPASQLPNIAAMPSSQHTSTYLAFDMNYYGYVYNKSKITASDLPASLQDLASDPALNGKMGLGSPTSSSSYTTYYAMLSKDWGASTFNSWVTNMLVNQKTQVIDVTASIPTEVASGELSIAGATLYNQVSTLVSQGAPLAFKYYSPTMELPSGMLTFKKSPDPAATQVFLNFIMSKDAQEIICGNQQCGSYLNVPGSIKPPPGVEVGDPALGDSQSKSIISLFAANS